MEDSEGWREARALIGNYVRQRVPAEDVDDVVSDILLRAVRYRDSLAAASNPVAWLRRVASSKVADYYRHRNRNKPDDLNILINGEEADAPDLAACLVPMIDRLPAKYAEALTLVDIRDQRIAAAAREAAVSLSAMKSRLRRGRDMLRQRFLNCCHVETDRRGGIMKVEPRRDRPSCC